jgi:hypothetical protein
MVRVSTAAPRPRRKPSAPAPSWSVYTTFRKARLALGRGFPTLEEARVYAIRLRRERFHDRDAIHVIDDATGQACALPAEADPAAEAALGARIDGPPLSGTQRTGFTVYATFHRGHIPLARKVETLEDAAAVVESFRRNRFDNSQSLVIVDEATGERIAAEDLVSLPTGPSRERILELHGVADEAAAVLSAAAARERWQPWTDRATRLHQLCRGLLGVANAAASRRRARRPISGTRARVAGAA